MSTYNDWEGFQHVYLEDSFVLSIDEAPKKITITAEIVLTEGHPLFVPPKEDQAHCYAIGKIVFDNVEEIRWLTKNFRPFYDANNSEDYGNIDILDIDKGVFHMLGDWGEVLIRSSPPRIIWADS